jgi:LysM repeat protein
MRIWSGQLRKLSMIVIVLGVLSPAEPARLAAAPAAGTDAASVPPLEDFSPALLGMYRKVMEIDDSIERFSKQYGVDPALARAVCMFESGGNPNLTSVAGARGYFQVMPATFRLMRASSNIEAGIKYLSQLIRQFGREDYALAGYNGGPGRVARGRAMPLESLQYVIGVGYYRSVLKQHEEAVRAHASTLGLVQSRAGDQWDALAARLDVPALVLKLYNPFVTDARLRRGTFPIVYPPDPVSDLFEMTDDGQRRYRARIGDNYIHLAFALGVDVDRLRDANELWRLQVLPVDMMLTIPSGPAPPSVARVAPPRPVVTRPASIVHRVKRGETLSQIARRYGTSIQTIQRANSLGRRTVIRVGQRLRVPR